MHILIAPNAFKNSLDAETAAQAIAEGLQQSALACSMECFPVGDGGDGTGALIIAQKNGTLRKAWVHDALGRPAEATFGLLDDGATAVIEMARASGLDLVKDLPLDVLRASSLGTGELLVAALDAGATNIILGMGGSATVDVGAGILHALGARLLDGSGKALQPNPAALGPLSVVDLSRVHPRLKTANITVLCDVANPLLGPSGAAAVFGPQKGASPEQVIALEAALARFAKVVKQQTGREIGARQHCGTAGGAAGGLFGCLNARLVNGIEYFLELTGFDAALQKADLVMTGEGSLDAQTLSGKAPFGVAKRAKARGLPVVGLAGKISLPVDASLRAYFDVLLAIGNEPMGMSEAMSATADNLARSATEIGNLLSIRIKQPHAVEPGH